MAPTDNQPDTATAATVNGKGKHKLNMSLDLRVVVILLLVVIAGMLFVWKPWSEAATSAADSRTIKVTGEASLKAEPDEYVFSPMYTVQNSTSDQAAALEELSKKSQTIVDGLKALGIKDSQIKTNADGYNRGELLPINPTDPAAPKPTATYSLRLTITVTEREQAQKVQNYLNTTTPTGPVTPYANFSATKRKQLEDQARDAATKDARRKADQSANNLGFELGKVKSVSDGSGFGAIPFAERGIASDTAVTTVPAPAELSVQPGENELSYSVSVEYFVK